MLSFFKKTPKVPPSLIARVRPLWMFESYAYNTMVDIGLTRNDEYLGVSEPYCIPYEADLGIGFGYENENKNIVLVRCCDVKDWKVYDSKLVEQAMANILSQKPLFTSPYEGVWLSKLKSFDSGIMLCKEEINKLSLESTPILFFLNRDSILVTGLEDTNGMNFCMDAVKTYMLEHQDGLTTDTYGLVDNAWVKVNIDGNTEIAQEFTDLSFNGKNAVTNEFLETLENLYGEEELFISRYNFLGDAQKGYFSFACWMARPRSWIPKVDRIILASVEGNELPEEETDEHIQEMVFDWDCVHEVLGSQMQRLDFHHDIWEFNGFPTPQEIEEIKKLQANASRTQS